MPPTEDEPLRRDGVLTRAGMEKAIKDGGSVPYRGRTITRIEDLPDDAALIDLGVETQEAAQARLDAQQARLDADRARLSRTRQATAAPRETTESPASAPAEQSAPTDAPKGEDEHPADAPRGLLNPPKAGKK